MGQEALCTARYGGQSAEGKAHLDTDELTFRGAFRLRIPYAELREVISHDGVLRVSWGQERAELELGAVAEKWAEKLRNPRTLADKLGVKPGMRTSVVGLDDGAFLRLLEARGTELHLGAPASESDLIFFAAAERAALSELPRLRDSLKPAGALWVIRPKGSPQITEAEVMTAARQAGLVDVKVARFSETHTAEKLVIPVAQRTRET